VSLLSSLNELQPLCWRSGITPQLWARLANFTQLLSICIGMHHADE
jgi:hypothetical protein